MEETIAPTAEELIVKHLEDNGQKMSWLAKKLGKSTGHLYLVLKGSKDNKRELSEDNRKKINEVLNSHY